MNLLQDIKIMFIMVVRTQKRSQGVFSEKIYYINLLEIWKAMKNQLWITIGLKAIELRY